MAKGGACMVKREVCMACSPPPHEIRPVIARAVRILLECILGLTFITACNSSCAKVMFCQSFRSRG